MYNTGVNIPTLGVKRAPYHDFLYQICTYIILGSRPVGFAQMAHNMRCFVRMYVLVCMYKGEFLMGLWRR